MTEAEFATQFEGSKKTSGLFELGGWRWCHFRPAMSQKGWRTPLSGDKGLPDYIATRRRENEYRKETLFIEIKGEGGRLTLEEKDWVADLRAAGQSVHVWWPKDYQDAQEVLLANCDFDFARVKENGRLL
ncbi:hypothetical protein LCGC14_0894400 [marine sediment metagenome]|uniref:VRR-NUC domain-containing protein n=2 Tax=marine sediment metagenome TaxID=412755 RepID=A0A0F9NYC5_9ZZZZ